MKKYILLSALSIILFSCKKTETPTPQAQPVVNNTGGGNNNGNNTGPVDTTYTIMEKVGGFSNAEYSFPPATQTIALPGAPNIGYNAYGESEMTDITLNGSGTKLIVGDVIKFRAWTTETYPTGSYFDFQIYLKKSYLVNNTITNIGIIVHYSYITVPPAPSVPSSYYKIVTFTIGSL